MTVLKQVGYGMTGHALTVPVPVQRWWRSTGAVEYDNKAGWESKPMGNFHSE